jgi:hypothetical protein
VPDIAEGRLKKILEFKALLNGIPFALLIGSLTGKQITITIGISFYNCAELLSKGGDKRNSFIIIR